MDQLWAPWRRSYIAKEAPEPNVCFVCRGLAAKDDRTNLVVERTRYGVVILNRFPYNNGHLLVAPIAHKARLDELTAEETLDLQQALTRLTTVLTNLMKPDGFNIGLNLGAAAGAGLPGHLHWHIVPRWVGDSNFMPVLSEARVISQSLESLYDLLYPALHPA